MLTPDEAAAVKAAQNAIIDQYTTPTGPTGPTGPTAPTAPTGPTSPTAPTGPTGSPGTGAWTLLNQGPQTVGTTVPYAGQGFWKPCPLNDGSIIFGSGAFPSTWKFDCNTGLWARTNTNTTQWFKAGIGQSENYAMRLDTDRNRPCMGVGGPYAWRMAGGDNTSSPFNGDVEYHPDIDEWFTPYPFNNSTFIPANADDTAHWDASGKGKNVSYFDGASGYWSKKIFGFGAYSIGVGPLRYRDMTTGVVTVLTNDIPVSPANWPRAYCQGSVDTNGQAWMFQANWDYCTWTWGSPTNSKWVHSAIINPPQIPPLTGYTFTDSGAISELN